MAEIQNGRDRDRSRSPTTIQANIQNLFPPRSSTIVHSDNKLTILGIPYNMRWSELKDFSKKYGDSCTFSRTFFHQGIWSGLLEYRYNRITIVCSRNLRGSVSRGATA